MIDAEITKLFSYDKQFVSKAIRLGINKLI